MKIQPTPKDLSKPFTGLFKLTDREYFSEELSSWAVSQSTFKRIKNESYKSILEKEIADTKAKRVGSAAHLLCLEGREVYESEVFVREDFIPFMKKADFIELYGSEVDLVEIPELISKEEYFEKRMEGIDDPGKFPTQKDYVANGGNKEDWRVEKTEHDRKEDAYKKQMAVIKDAYEAHKKDIKELKEQNTKLLKEVEDRWREGKQKFDLEKEQYELRLREAEREGKIILSFEESEIAEMIYIAFQKSRAVQNVMKGSQTELTGIAFHKKSGQYIKVKFDIINLLTGVLTDKKTADEVGNDAFFWSFKKWEYDIQLATYLWVANELGIKINEIKSLVANKKVEEIAVYNGLKDFVEDKWPEAERRLIQYTKEKREYERGMNRYDIELTLTDPREDNVNNIIEEINSLEFVG